jgi:hypothetical protein
MKMKDKMKIIFLDIDGVLTSEKSRDLSRNWKSFSPESMETLNYITGISGAKVVITSTWRIKYDQEELSKIFKSQGISADIIGCTRNLGLERGIEIDEWLKRHKGKIESFVIIDDGSDMDMHSDRLVMTTFREGLRQRHIELVLEQLERAL